MNFKSRLALCWRILRADAGGLLAHADRELPHIGTGDMGRMMAQNLREMVLVFATQGHSGLSAIYTTHVLADLLQFKPLAPLTGNDSEWVEVYDEVFQNNRCSRVFKDSERFNGNAYDIDAVVFREPSGACFTGRGSSQPIFFPYTPRTVYVDVDEEGTPLNGWDREGVCPEWVKN